jgi:hypothetical protein
MNPLAKANMTRLHGQCARGQQLIAKVPHGHRKTLPFVASSRCDGVMAPCVFDGPIDGESCLAWVVQFLVPALRAGDIVVIDNLSVTRTRRCAMRYARWVPNCSTCHPTALI